MKRETLYQHIKQYLAPDEGDDDKMRALYAYAVKRKFPSPEVLFNKAYELATGQDAVGGMFAEQPETVRAQYTALRAVTEALEPYADEPIEAFAIAATQPAEPQPGKPEAGAAPDASSTQPLAAATGPTDGAPAGAGTPTPQPEPADDGPSIDSEGNPAPPLSGKPLAGASDAKPTKSQK